MPQYNCFLFPGQGSQSVGMCHEILDNKSFEKKIISANTILGYDIKYMILNGPSEILNKTKYTQPSIFIISCLIDTLLKKKKIYPNVVAGHSLGEYSALVSAGVLEFEDALKIIKVRSEEMDNAGNINAGGMLAIFGASNQQIKSLCNNSKTLVPANYNSKEQVVLSGDINSIEKATIECRKMGIRRVLPLKTSGAFHSPLMKSARESLVNVIESVTFHDAKIPIYQNTNPHPEKNSNDIKNNLFNQLEMPVQWLKTILNINSNKIAHYIEVGPGKVLTKLNNRILNNKNTLTYNEVIY